jgi:hypothetical protein
MYVAALANAAPTRRVPHCEWIIVETIDSWWCDDIIRPRSRMTRAGKGFIGNR